MASKWLGFAMFFLATIILVIGNLPSMAADCDFYQMPPILQKCNDFMQKPGSKILPSQECCSVLKDVDVPCICDTFITPPVEDTISIGKLIYVATTCGRPVPPPGATCGSYIIPSPGPTSSPVRGVTSTFRKQSHE